jgi:hypothetical protein
MILRVDIIILSKGVIGMVSALKNVILIVPIGASICVFGRSSKRGDVFQLHGKPRSLEMDQDVDTRILSATSTALDRR